jgi:hypothetical protein
LVLIFALSFTCMFLYFNIIVHTWRTPWRFKNVFVILINKSFMRTIHNKCSYKITSLVQTLFFIIFLFYFIFLFLFLFLHFQLWNWYIKHLIKKIHCLDRSTKYRNKSCKHVNYLWKYGSLNQCIFFIKCFIYQFHSWKCKNIFS